MRTNFEFSPLPSPPLASSYSLYNVVPFPSSRGSVVVVRFWYRFSLFQGMTDGVVRPPESRRNKCKFFSMLNLRSSSVSDYIRWFGFSDISICSLVSICSGICSFSTPDSKLLTWACLIIVNKNLKASTDHRSNTTGVEKNQSIKMFNLKNSHSEVFSNRKSFLNLYRI